jgi:hypothetical protein
MQLVIVLAVAIYRARKLKKKESNTNRLDLLDFSLKFFVLCLIFDILYSSGDASCESFWFMPVMNWRNWMVLRKRMRRAW